jgi:hypothetical protein
MSMSCFLLNLCSFCDMQQMVNPVSLVTENRPVVVEMGPVMTVLPLPDRQQLHLSAVTLLLQSSGDSNYQSSLARRGTTAVSLCAWITEWQRWG